MDSDTQKALDFVRAKIFRGEWPAGTRVTDEAVRRGSGATYRAVRVAMRELKKEGLLLRRQRLGSFVSSRRPPGSMPAVPRLHAVGVLSSMSAAALRANTYTREVLHGIEAQLAPGGRVHLLCEQPAHTGRARLSEVPQLDMDACRERFEGLIALEANNATVLNEWVRAGFAVTAVAFNRAGDMFDAVSFDFETAGYLVTHQLRSLGHRRIAFVGEPPNFYSDDPSWQQRLTGYLRAMSEAPAVDVTEWIIDISRSHTYVGRYLPAFHHDVKPSAYVAATGGALQEILKSLDGMGLACPQDVSVASCDGLHWEMKSGGRSTHVPMDLHLLGRTALNLVAGRIVSRALPVMAHTLPVKLLNGSTTGPAAT